MVPLVALLAIVSEDVKAEDAVAIARTFLKDMGAVPVGRTMGTYPTHGQPPSGQFGNAWDVVFEASAAQWFHVGVDHTGTVFEVSLNVRSKDRIPVERAREIARRLLAKVPHTVPVRQSSNQPGTFHALVGGHPFLNLNTDYGYEIEFDGQGRLEGFSRRDVVPEIRSTEPVIDEGTARTRLESAWRADKPSDWPYPRRVQALLGYYAAYGEARLVWGGKVAYLANGRWITMEPLRTAIDATTGEPIAAEIEVWDP